jgi:hypothetical protein
MKPSGFRWGRALAVTLLLVFLGLVAIVAIVGAALPLDHVTLMIDGETVRFDEVRGTDAAIAVVAVAAALLVALILGTTAVVFALLAAALSIGVALILVLATLAVAASPLLLIAWAIWRLSRPSPRHPPPQAPVVA